MQDSMLSSFTSYMTAFLAGVISMDTNEWLLLLSVFLVVARLCIEVPKAIRSIKEFF